MTRPPAAYERLFMAYEPARVLKRDAPPPKESAPPIAPPKLPPKVPCSKCKSGCFAVEGKPDLCYVCRRSEARNAERIAWRLANPHLRPRGQKPRGFKEP